MLKILEVVSVEDGIVVIAEESIDRLFNRRFMEKYLNGISIDNLFREAKVKFPQKNENLGEDDLAKLDDIINKKTNGKLRNWQELFETASSELVDNRPNTSIKFIR